jgi:hypothetical protein
MMGREQLLPHLLILNPLTDVDVSEDPKRLKREWETPTEVVTV